MKNKTITQKQAKHIVRLLSWALVFHTSRLEFKNSDISDEDEALVRYYMGEFVNKQIKNDEEFKTKGFPSDIIQYVKKTF